MTSTPHHRPTPADIVEMALQSRAVGAPVQEAALASPTMSNGSVLDELRSPAARKAQPGIVQRLVNQRHLQVALAPVHIEVIKAAAEVYKLEELSRIDAVRDRVNHKFLLGKAQHAEQTLVAAQLLDEQLVRLQELGEDRLEKRDAARLIELNERYANGLITKEAFQAKAQRSMRRYEKLEERLDDRVNSVRSTADAMIAPAANTRR